MYSDIWASGNTAIVGSYGTGSGAAIIDITNPAQPQLHTRYHTQNNAIVNDVKIVSSTAYLATDGDGVHIIDISTPATPDLLGTITSSIGGYNSIHNISLDNDILYQASFAISTVIKVFDVSNPAAPTFIREFDSANTNSLLVHDITAINNRLYTSGFGGVTDIYDVSGIVTAAPVLLGSFTTGSVNHSNWPSADGNLIAIAHETQDGTLQLYDISDMSNIQLVSTIEASSFGINAYSPHNPIIIGSTLYVSWYEAGLQMFDISNPANPSHIAGFNSYTGNCSSNFGNWGVYPFLGSDKILISDGSHGLFVLDASTVVP
ncbi:MAG: choice-of-anchor B family protein [Acidiferrobacterales bacterium]